MDKKQSKYFFNDILDNILKVCEMKNINYNEFVERFSIKSKYSIDYANQILKSSDELELTDLLNICSSLNFSNFEFILFSKKYNNIKEFTLDMLDKFLDNKTEKEQLIYLEKISDLIYKNK